MSKMTIGQVARQSGVGIETIRYYERERLIPEPPRTAAGYRHYPVDSVRRLAFIRHAKALGFTLADIRQLLSLKAESSATSERVRQLAQEKLTEIREKIETLQKMAATLEHLVDQCPGHVLTSDCPILDALAEPDTAPAYTETGQDA